MTDSELLTIIISGLSFFVSFRGIIIAKKAVAKADEANALSREQNVLALRQAKSAELSFFEQCLFRIEQRLKIPLYDLCRKAREALINVSKLFDKYDRRENDSEFLRHIFHEFCSAMGSGLSSQITWQTSEYLHSELSSLYSMDDEVINIERIINSFDLNIYFGPFPKRNGFLKLKHNRVPGDAVDWGEKLKKIYDGVDKTKVRQIFIESREFCQDYFQSFEEIKLLLTMSIDELNSLLSLNKNREFKLQESRALYQKYMGMIRKLEFLSKCDMYLIRRVSEEYIDDSIARLIYIGVILAIVSSKAFYM